MNKCVLEFISMVEYRDICTLASLRLYKKYFSIVFLSVGRKIYVILALYTKIEIEMINE